MTIWVIIMGDFVTRTELWQVHLSHLMLPLGYTLASMLRFWKVSRFLMMFTQLDSVWLQFRNYHYVGFYNAVSFLVAKFRAIKM